MIKKIIEENNLHVMATFARWIMAYPGGIKMVRVAYHPPLCVVLLSSSLTSRTGGTRLSCRDRSLSRAPTSVSRVRAQAFLPNPHRRPPHHRLDPP